MYNVLVSAVGNMRDRDGNPMVGNVTDVIDRLGILDEVILLNSKGSVDNSRVIKDKYPKMKIRIVPGLPEPENTMQNGSSDAVTDADAIPNAANTDSFPTSAEIGGEIQNNSSLEQYLNPLDYNSVMNQFFDTKTQTEAEHPRDKIHFFVNITAGTKLVSAAAAAASVLMNATVCYAQDNKDGKLTAEESIIRVEPDKIFDPSKLKEKDRRIFEKILGHIKNNEARTRAEIAKKMNNSVQKISYRVRVMKDECGLIRERNPEARKDVILELTTKGELVYKYLYATKNNQKTVE